MPSLASRKVVFNNQGTDYRLQEPSQMAGPSPSPQQANVPFSRGFISPFFSYDFEVDAINPRGARFFRTWNVVNTQSQNLALLASKTKLR